MQNWQYSGFQLYLGWHGKAVVNKKLQYNIDVPIKDDFNLFTRGIHLLQL